jgi:hypothetical protein
VRLSGVVPVALAPAETFALFTPGTSIAYARIEANRAGTVSVACEPAPDGTTLAQVDYDLTALTPEADEALTKFAEHYDRFLGHWQEAIAEAGRREAGPPAT